MAAAKPTYQLPTAQYASNLHKKTAMNRTRYWAHVGLRAVNGSTVSHGQCALGDSSNFFSGRCFARAFFLYLRCFFRDERAEPMSFSHLLRRKYTPLSSVECVALS